MLTADAALATLAAFPEPPAPSHDPEPRMRWLAARFDAGDTAGAAELTLAELVGCLHRSFADDGARVLRSLGPERALQAILGSGKLLDRWPSSSGDRYEDHVAAALAPAVAGLADAEDVVLRAVLEPIRADARAPEVLARSVRISATIAAFSGVYPSDAAEPVDRWAAVLAASPSGDTPSLAAAARQLAPLGLAAIDARCGRVADHDGPALVEALGAHGNVGDALKLAARLGVKARQDALLRLADATGPDAADRVIAAFRKCPKVSQKTPDKQRWQERLGGIQLGYGRIDDAFATLAEMRGSKYVGYGPALLVGRMLRDLDPAELTEERIRTLLATLLSAEVTTQDLVGLATEALMVLYSAADAALRAELLAVHAERWLVRLRGQPREMVAAGFALAGAHPDSGDPTSWIWQSPVVVAATVAAGWPAARPESYARAAARLLSSPASGTAGRRMRQLLPAIPAGPLAAALAALPDDEHRAKAATGLAAAAGDDLALLGLALAAAPDAASAHAVARHATAALARNGDLDGAVRLAGVCF
ncbi:hypothetical protein [Dactylosporangium sp. NPDC051541]|uniref:hypothetical protein n=1 Tax=Dactylosporangium sp. NPDC051541 TaxID=3363977 RepID=UPI00378B1876